MDNEDWWKVERRPYTVSVYELIDFPDFYYFQLLEINGLEPSNNLVINRFDGIRLLVKEERVILGPPGELELLNSYIMSLNIDDKDKSYFQRF